MIQIRPVSDLRNKFPEIEKIVEFYRACDEMIEGRFILSDQRLHLWFL